jgi:uncharacterized membrane protein
MVPAVDQVELELRSCPHCAAQMPANAAFCPGCGRSMHAAVQSQGKLGGLSENVAGALAYFTFLPALAFLLLEPYKKSGFVRFHSIQCLLGWVALIIAAAVLRLVGLLLFIIPAFGPLIVLLVDVTAALAAIFIWIVLVVKAAQGETFKLPWLGDLAEQYSVPG